MAEGTLSGTQAMLQRRTSPELFAAMERESRLWMAECPNCRADTPLWEMGAVRYRAAGEPKKRMRCPRCGQTGFMRVHWTGGDPEALGPRPSVAPLVLKILVFTVLLPLLVVGAVIGAIVAFT